MKKRETNSKYPLDGWKGTTLRSGLIGYRLQMRRKGRTIYMTVAPTSSSQKAWAWRVSADLLGPAHEQQGEVSTLADAAAAARAAAATL